MTESISKIFQKLNLKPKDLLKPDPTIEFFEESHRYYDLKRKHWVSKSVTEIAKKSSYLNQVLKRGDDDKVKQNILKSIDRGNKVHAAVEEFFKTGKPGNAGIYQDWVNQFINNPNLEGWSCLASEFRLIDRRYDIAGSLDFLLEKNGRVVLCDLKTKGKEFSKNHMDVKTQLGGYLSIFWVNYPSIEIDSCRVYWVTPEKCTTDEYDKITCLELYEKARSIFNQNQPTF